MNELITQDKVDFVKVHYPMKQIQWAIKNLNIWEKRSEELPFYTIGKSAYLDGDTPEYHDNIGYLNHRLFSFSPALYMYVLAALAKYFMETVSLDKDLAFPGFHIFVNDPILLTTAGNWHVDLPHETLGLGDKDPYAFTLAVEMPGGGGGIDFDTGEYVEHKVGYMMIHDGKTAHRISALKEAYGGRNRITLQGHIIRKESKLVAFW
jgi:hypothetical protein